MPNDLLDSLNERQKEAVITTEGYVRVIAGAGSGKTKALAHRYAYIVKYLGIDPSNILCVTFTNKAAQEMRRRVRRLIGEGYDTGLIATYHGFCVRVLREDIHHMYYGRNFFILDEEDQKSILRDIYEELGINLKYISFKNALKAIKEYKNHHLDYVYLLANPNNVIKPDEEVDLIDKIIKFYLLKQRKIFALDFDDLINFTLVLFHDNKDILEKWRNRLHYIQVDEFQDSNRKQFILIQLLSGKHRNLFVVGDPDQTIYEWRGARPEYLVDFDKAFTPCSTIILNQNYRSTPEILSISNSLIKKNQLRVDKDMMTENPAGIRVIHFHGKNDEDEVMWIVNKIKELIGKRVKFSDIAIIYRANFLSRTIEQVLIRADIKYTIYGSIRFFERKEIKDALAYLRLLAIGDDLSFMRVVNTPKRGIGKTKIRFIKDKSNEEGISLYEALKKNVYSPIFYKTEVKGFINTIEKLKAISNKMRVSDLLQSVLHESGYESFLRQDGDQDRIDNLSELVNSIVQYETTAGEDVNLEDYLRSIALFTDLDRDERHDSVKLMTIHIAKGLEFPYVFLYGLTEGILPNARAMEDRNTRGLEEERRLAYVAMTRAIKELYLTESEGIQHNGNWKYPSRFLFDIEEGLYDRIGIIDEDIIKQAKSFKGSSKIFNSKKDIERILVGDVIIHPVFGEGQVIEIDYDGNIYQINFDEKFGLKPISFNFAGLRKMSKE